VQGRESNSADLEDIRQLRRDHAQWSSYRLSVELTQRWNWRNEAGQLKDMSARTLLLKLHTDGWIHHYHRTRSSRIRPAQDEFGRSTGSKNGS
jgi:hypothetical protein